MEADVKPFERLPADRRARSLALVKRALPDPTRQIPPGMPRDVAEMLQTSRNERAIVVTALDDTSDEILTLTSEIASSGVVVDLLEDDTSVVNAIESVRVQAAKAR
jgi:hypothetical protein